jgi:hypothetical protein
MSPPRRRDADSMKGGATVRSMMETMVQAVAWAASLVPLEGRRHVFTCSIGSYRHFNTLRLRGAKSERPRRTTNRYSMTRSSSSARPSRICRTCSATIRALCCSCEWRDPVPWGCEPTRHGQYWIRFGQGAESASCATCGRTATSHSRPANSAFKHDETGHDHGPRARGGCRRVRMGNRHHRAACR